MKKYVLAGMALCFGLQGMAQTSAVNRLEMQVAEFAPLIKTNPSAASEAFDDMLKGKSKKDIGLLLEIGRAYLQAGKYAEAIGYADRAKEIYPKCAEAYLLSGDVAMAKNDVNQASADYNQAIFLDENCAEAYLKYAEVYQKVNPQLSLEMLERLQIKFPDDIRVNKQMGDIYYDMGEYGKAIAAYEGYMSKGEPSAQDYVRHAMLLYLNKEFDRSLESVRKGKVLQADNQVLKRLDMYNNYELGNYDAGVESAIALFKDPDDPELIYLDYVYWGRLLGAKEQYEEAILQFKKALALDENQADVYRDMATMYEKLEDYPNAIATFQTYMSALKTPSDVGDLFLYGRLNYYVAADSSSIANRPHYLAKADTAFARVMKHAPDNYLGSFWRARTNSLLDPETTQGLAKPHYETALAILEKKPDASVPVLVECLSYLGYYYFIKEDYPLSKYYWNEILAIDPDNQTAKTALEGIQ